jgi:hypothetical protein
MSEEMSIVLEDLQEIMDMLPDVPIAGEKRKNSLTRDDVLVIAKIIQAMSPNSCSMGFSVEEIGKLKMAVQLVNKGILGVGWLILAAIVAGLIKATWWGVQHGILDAADTVHKTAGK